MENGDYIIVSIETPNGEVVKYIERKEFDIWFIWTVSNELYFIFVSFEWFIFLVGMSKCPRRETVMPKTGLNMDKYIDPRFHISFYTILIFSTFEWDRVFAFVDKCPSCPSKRGLYINVWMWINLNWFKSHLDTWTLGHFLLKIVTVRYIRYTKHRILLYFSATFEKCPNGKSVQVSVQVLGQCPSWTWTDWQK